MNIHEVVDYGCLWFCWFIGLEEARNNPRMARAELNQAIYSTSYAITDPWWIIIIMTFASSAKSYLASKL